MRWAPGSPEPAIDFPAKAQPSGHTPDVQERVMFFDPGYGIGLTIAAGSGRSWVQTPAGDPVTAHLHVDVAGESIVVAGIVEDRRWRSRTGFVPWDELLRFADRLDALAAQGTGVAELAADPGFRLVVRLREDGRAQAETVFEVGHHVHIGVTARTHWDWHEGSRQDLTDTAWRIRSAVRTRRPTQHNGRPVALEEGGEED
jgi:hypothetical protein